MKRRFSVAFLLTFAALGGGLVLAAALKPVTHFSGGITGYSGLMSAPSGQPHNDCRICHGGPDPNATARFTSTDGTLLASAVGDTRTDGNLGLYPGETVTLRYTLSLPTAAMFGVNIATNGGTLTEDESGLAITSGEIHHIAAGRKAVPAGGSGYYTFTYTQTAFNETSPFRLAGASAWGPTNSGKTVTSVRLNMVSRRPADPSALAAGTASATSIPLSWSGAGPAYRVIAKPGGQATGPTDTAGAFVYDVSTTNTIATGLTSSTTYYISVWGRATFSGIDTFSANASQIIATTAMADPPSITTISPGSGSTSGGDSVAINGTGFVIGSGLRVSFGGVDAALDLGSSSSTSINATTPAHAAGAVDVIVVNPDGQSAVRTGGFIYTCPVDLAPPSANYSSAAATGSIQVSADGGCGWTATAPDGSFVTITGGASGTGSGTVSYAVGENSAGTSRFTTITVGGETFAVTQSASGIMAIALTATASPTEVSLAWTSAPGASSYEIQRSSNGAPFSVITSINALAFADTAVTAGSGYLYRIRALGSGGGIAYSNVDLAVPIAYTYPSLTAGTSLIHAADVMELRQVVAAARTALGWRPLSFTDSALAGVPVKRVHFTELRSGVDGVRAGVGLPPVIYTDSTITAGLTAVRVAHVTELRNGVE